MVSQDDSVQLTVRLDRGVHGRLVAFGGREDRSLNWLVNEACRRFSEPGTVNLSSFTLGPIVEVDPERTVADSDAVIDEVKRGHAAAFETPATAEKPKAGPVADIAEQLERVTQQKGKATTPPQQESRSPGRKVKDRGVPVVEDKPCPHPASKRVNKSGLVGCDACGAVKTVSGEWRVPDA